MAIKVAAVSLNQTPLDWDNNQSNIQRAINEAKEKKVDLLVFPELCTTGYGCEDGFFMDGLTEESLSMIKELSIPENMYVVLGSPFEYNNRLYNGAIVLARSKIVGVILKQNLAINGIHYENRWFNAWEAGYTFNVSLPEFQEELIPIGDIVINANGINLGFEICEDAWVASRPGRDLFEKGVDIIINPSASHFAIGKNATREQFVKEGSRSFGAAYIYSNLNGCESGRAVFDGGNLIASNGQIISYGERLHYKDHSLTLATIDVKENRANQKNNSQKLDLEKTEANIIFSSLPLEKSENKYLPTTGNFNQLYKTNYTWQYSQYLAHEEATRAVALGLHHWLMKTYTNGFVLSLSGGADSGLVASVISYMSKYILQEYTFDNSEENRYINDFIEKFVGEDIIKQLEKNSITIDEASKITVNNILTCVYQGSKNSGEVTLTAAKEVANGIGSKFFDWKISHLVDSYTDMVNNTSERNMTWEEDDITLQNIQARVRAPGVWMIANRDNKLLLTTGNLSESAVGYMTMDGDTAGVLAPISGISKTRILDLLRWMEKEGSLIGKEASKIPALSFINNQRPTAELRPEEQADEDDLMPFYVMDSIRKQAFMLRRKPRMILEQLKHDCEYIEEEQLIVYIEKFYTLFSRNQWKRDRAAPSFHIEEDSLDPKTYSRYPLLNSGWKKELAELRYK